MSIVGAWLVKKEGMGVLRRAQDQVRRGEVPARELVDGVLAFLAARGYPDAKAVHSAEESLIFALPPELRRDLRAAQQS